MGALSATMYSLLQQRNVEAYWLFEIDLPTGTTVRFTQQGVHVLATGFYESWLLSIGAVNRQLSNWRNGLPAVTFGVSLNDIGGQFSQAYGRKFRGAVCRLKLLCYDDSTKSQATHTCFTGIVDSVSKADDIIDVRCRINDDWLDKRASRAWIRTDTFPNLNGSDARDKSLPYIAGSHDSTGLNATGMLPAYLVDTVNFRYAVSMGQWLYDFARVYADGQLVTPDQYEMLETWTADGRKVTLIDFVADQGAKEITVDVQQDAAASTVYAGAYLLYLLINYVYNDFYHTAFAASTTPVQEATYNTLDAWIYTSMNINRSFYIPADGITGREILRRFLDSYDVLAYWTAAGKLAVTHWEYRTQNDDIYPTNRLLTDADMLTKPSFEQDPESVVNHLQGSGSYRGADGAYLQRRTVWIETSESEREGKLEAPWLVASADFIGSTTELTTDATTSSSGMTAVGGAATIHQNLAAAFDSTVYVETNSAGTANFICTLSNIPTVASIESVKIEYWARKSGAGTSIDETTIPGLYISAVKYDGNTLDQISSTWRLVTGGVWTVNPATNLKFTESDINGMSVRFDWDAGTTVNVKHRYAKLRIVVYYTAQAAITPALLTILSKRVNRFGVSPELLRVEVPLEYLDYELGDLIQVQDVREGWGDAPYERELMRVVGSKLIPEKYRIELLLESVMDTLTSFRLFGKALESIGTTSTGDGVLLLTHGGTVTMNRASVKNLDSPAGSTFQTVGPIIQINANTLPCDRYGLHSESAATNYLKGAAFQSGSTYTDSTPAGSGTIIDDTTVGEQLFPDSTVTDRHCLFTAASPHTATSRRTFAASHSLSAGAPARVSIWYKCSSATGGDGPSWRLVRDSDGYYWNDSTGGWQVGSVDNTLTAVTSWTRADSKAMPAMVGKTNTFTFSIALPSGGTASRTVRVGLCALQNTYWPDSPMLSTAAAASTRATDALTIANDKSDGTTTFRVWPNTRGTAVFKCKPNWNYADITSYGLTYTFPLFELGYDASNWWRLYYDFNSGAAGEEWTFQARAGGVNYTAQVTDSGYVKGSEYEIRVRWTSTAKAEWGYSNYLTLYVFRDGALVGSHTLAYTTPTLAAGATCYLFCNAGGYNFNGQIQEMTIYPRCWSDAEMAALP